MARNGAEPALGVSAGPTEDAEASELAAPETAAAHAGAAAAAVISSSHGALAVGPAGLAGPYTPSTPPRGRSRRGGALNGRTGKRDVAHRRAAH